MSGVCPFYQEHLVQMIGSYELEAGETTPLPKTSDMNQNESAKGGRGKGFPLIKG